MEHSVDIYNKHLPRCTASYVIKQMPITTTRYQCPPLKMAHIQDADRQHQMLLKVWSSKASAFVSREAKQPQLWWLPVKLNILPPSSPAHVYPKELETVSTHKPTRRCLPQFFFPKANEFSSHEGKQLSIWKRMESTQNGCVLSFCKIIKRLVVAVVRGAAERRN